MSLHFLSLPKPNKKLLIFLNLLILWHSGSDFKVQSGGPYGNLGTNTVTAPPPPVGELPQAEVSSVTTVVNQLKPRIPVSPAITKSYCSKSQSNYGFSITCTDGCNEARPCQIKTLIFTSMGLSGAIDEAIGDLTALTTINLANNDLKGPIPTTLGNLRNLETLDLSNNQLTGIIPDTLGNLPSLKYLYLKYNMLEGPIPSTLDQTSLIQLYLDYNRLSGSIPKSLGSLQSLTYLQLSENGLTGNLPEELGDLKNLKSFWMPSNYFTGEIPKTYERLTSLRWFAVAGNDLEGTLPNIAGWTNIEALWLQGNKFEGPLPGVYFDMPYLEQLLISDLRGTSETKFPTTVKFSNMNRLVLRRCFLQGPFPEFIGELSALKHLDLSFNSLTGHIPESMRPNLISMSVANNNLNGTIPNWILQSSGTRIDLSYNNFTKLDTPIPSELNLNVFSCCCCEVSEGATEPYMLETSRMMNSYFPKKKHKFYSLHINSGGEQTHLNKTLYEADNGTSPFYVSPAKNWAYSFSGDFLSPTINSSEYTKKISCRVSNSESSLYDDARLSPVSLSYYGLGLYKGHYNVTLHFAEIVYSEQKDYFSLRKRIFDIYIQDKLQIPDFNIRSRAGGPNKATKLTFPAEVNESSLLHIHLYWSGKGSYLYPPAFNGPLVSAISVNPLFKVGNELSAWKIALIAIASLVLVLLLLLALAWSMGWLENKELKKKVKVGEHLSGDDGKEDIMVTLKTLVAATGNFSDTKKIGSGYLGAVYKADVMESPKITVAVKKIYPRHKGKISGKIQNEIYLLKTLEGQNTVKLLDVHIGETLQLFIYEYMEKESLDTVLFNSKVGTFLWKTRFEICKGIARGLASLHQRSTRVVHGNLKASNILLDKYNNPKLSDFGYASIYNNDEDKFSLIKQRGPSGILAPEYCQGRDNELSAKTDIYSFGVVLIEIVAGHGNKESKGAQESTDLLEKVQVHFAKQKPSISKLIDPKIKGDKELNEREVELVLRLAVMCTSSSSMIRPWIHDVLSVLNGEKSLDEIRLSHSSAISNDLDDTIKSPASTSSK